jgi:hypothetical protein
MPRIYNEGQLPLEESLERAMRRVGGWREMAASLGVSYRSGVSWLASDWLVRGRLRFSPCELLVLEAGS